MLRAGCLLLLLLLRILLLLLLLWWSLLVCCCIAFFTGARKRAVQGQTVLKQRWHHLRSTPIAELMDQLHNGCPPGST